MKISDVVMCECVELVGMCVCVCRMRGAPIWTCMRDGDIRTFENVSVKKK